LVFRPNGQAWGWKIFEAPGVEPVFREKDQAIGYAETRACLDEVIGLLEFSPDSFPKS
jgi:hypothetical protein